MKSGFKRPTHEISQFKIMTHHALVLIDLQNDFLPGGALAVTGGNEIIPVVNRLMPNFQTIVATQDWHPPEHGSFAANHVGKSLYDVVELNGLPQVLWPVHCVQNTGGALFAPGLETQRIAKVFPKGTDREIDSYSGFFDNGQRGDTGLAGWLREMGVTELTLCGLATDYCVKYTAFDALKCGFRVNLATAGCRGVDLVVGDCANALAEMRERGVLIQ